MELTNGEIKAMEEIKKERELMKAGEGCQESYNCGMEDANVSWEKRTEDCPRCRLDGIPIEDKMKVRFEPANSTNNPAVTKTTQRYYKLHCGNVLDLETKTILNRDALLKILD